MEKVKEYKYYSTQRPVNIGTFPQNKGNRPIRLENYTGRTWVELNTRLAWGEVVYAKPLSDEEQRSYELMPSRNNPNVRKKMDAQAWVVGKWEDKNHVRYPKRLTWFYPDFGCYQVKEYVSPEQLAECARKAGKQDAEVEGIQNAPLLCGYIRRGLGCQTAESATEQKGHGACQGRLESDRPRRDPVRGRQHRVELLHRGTFSLLKPTMRHLCRHLTRCLEGHVRLARALPPGRF